jgi:hypothetical protein
LTDNTELHIPAEAVPPGVDANAYYDEMTGKTMSEPVVSTREEITSTRPAHIPEKFWDAANNRVNEDLLLKSYAELENHLRTKGAAKAEEPAQAAPAGQETAKIELPKVEAKTEAAPLQDALDAFQNRYLETNGEVTEDDVANLEKAGLPRQLIATYLAGVRALEASALATAHEIAGGKENFDAAATWAKSGLSPEEVENYNNLVSDPKTSKQAVEWLVSRFQAANPSEGAFVTGTPSASPGDVFSSKYEMTEAMKDPRYSRDPAFRQQIAEKLDRSIKAGTITSNTAHYS